MNDDDVMTISVEMVSNASRFVQLLKPGGRSFQSLAVLGKKEDMWALIRENGIENLFLKEGLM